jgi:hypothetical protein
MIAAVVSFKTRRRISSRSASSSPQALQYRNEIEVLGPPEPGMACVNQLDDIAPLR